MDPNLERLSSINSFPLLVTYLRDVLGWEFETEDIEGLTYDYTVSEFGLDPKSAAKIHSIKQLIPLVDKQPWGIFYLDFAGQNVSVAVLRAILRGLVAKKRASANQSEMQKWEVENLLFICTSDDFKNFNFGYFRGAQTNRAVLSTFGWHHGDTHLRTLNDFNLEALRFPSDTSNGEEWLKKWRAAFDVEKVTDEFFRRYNEVFTAVEQEVRPAVKDDRQGRLFTQKLFNRLMFIYFIQKKGWLSFKNEPKNKYLRALFNDALAKKQNFFSDRLYWLFFRGMSVADMSLGQTEELLRERRGEVPPLNGGLFELEDELDVRGRVPIENDVFGRILDLFERYNFTIEESTPLDVQVAVDPEMLGKVFEELITGRHETGSYYTPRPIVSFMCREALKHYLNGVQPSKEAVARFVDEEDASDLQNPEAVLDALKGVRVCDPACGSGAYLLGMLHELMRLRAALFRSNKIDDATLYERKRWIIENNLYGVDNDAFAVQIACLRLWLSLSIDSDAPRPLPNLDYKIEVGDSLIAPAPSEAEKQMTFARAALVSDFRHAKGDYMRETDPDRKRTLRQRIEDLRSEIALALEHQSLRLSKSQIQKKREELKTIAKSIDSARNATIRAQLKKQAEKIEQTLAANESAAKETDTGFDWAVEFAEVFTPAAREHWRMDDLHPMLNDFKLQGTLVEEAKPDTQFGGFDIVLANPPYVSALEFASKYSDELRERLNRGYVTARGSYDLYVLFYERSLQLLKKSGMLVFINPNKFLSARYAVALREFMLKSAALMSVTDISGIEIFRKTSVYPVIVMLKAGSDKSYAVKLNLPKRRVMDDFDLSQFYSFQVDSRFLRLLPENIWGFLLSDKLPLLEKMLRGTKFLSEVGSVNATSTASEADEYGGFISERKTRQSLKIINTGTIDRYASLWGKRPMTNAGQRLLKPYLSLARLSERRRDMYTSPKVIFAKMARMCEAVLDVSGEYASINTNCFYRPASDIDLRYIVAFCNSKTFMFFYHQFFGSLRMSGGYFQFQAPQLRVIPIMHLSLDDQKPLNGLTDKIVAAKLNNPEADTSKLESEVDKLIYKHYQLTDEEISIIEAVTKEL
jgi:type I restriction-modification system DNA methylase subunit